MIEQEWFSSKEETQLRLRGTLLSIRSFKTAIGLAIADGTTVGLLGSTEPYHNIGHLVDIATARTQIGQDPSDTLNLALSMAVQGYLGLEPRRFGLQNLVDLFPEMKQYHSNSEFESFLEIGRAQAGAGIDPTEAFAYSLRVLTGGSDRLWQIRSLVTAQSEAGLIDDAKQSLIFLHDEAHRIYKDLPDSVQGVLSPMNDAGNIAVTLALWKKGETEEFGDQFRIISTNYGRAKVYYLMAQASINEPERQELLVKALGYSLNTVDDPNFHGLDKYDHEVTESGVIGALLDLSPKNLGPVLSYIEELISRKVTKLESNLEKAYGSRNGFQYIRVRDEALQLMNGQKKRLAEILISKGFYEAASEIVDIHSDSRLIATLGKRLAMEGKIADALETLEEIDHSRRWYGPYIAVADQQISLGEDPSTVLGIAEMWGATNSRSSDAAWQAIATVWAKAGKLDIAQQFAHRIDPKAYYHPSSHCRSNAYFEIAKVYAARNDIRGVARMLPNITDLGTKIRVYITLGVSFANDGISSDKIFLLPEEYKQFIINGDNSDAIEAIRLFGSIPRQDQEVMERITPLLLGTQ